MALTGTHGLGGQTLSNVLFSFIKDGESFKEEAYFDTAVPPKATIGYGVNLHLAQYRNYVFNAMGITDATHRQLYTDAILGATPGVGANLNNDLQSRLNNVYAQLNPNAAERIFKISTTQARSVFDSIIADKETRLHPILGIGTANPLVPLNSREYVALMDMFYNTEVLITRDNDLHRALLADNRAEAWYEIRYNSNGGLSRNKGIANRRVAESDMFGLYDTNATNITEDEAKSIMRMYTLHKDRILKEESDFPTSYLGSNSFASQSAQAKNFLVDKFGEGVVIDGEILVGAGLDSYEYIDNGNYDDILTGTSKNDYLFGERGDDILIGNGGGDYMEGGEGYDTYYTNDKDTIYDSDGKGEVYFNGTLLVGGLFDESSGFYVSEDKSIEYQLVGNTLKVKNLVDGSELTVEGYIQKEQSLGINLANSLGKEVAIVIDTTGSMRSSIDIAKQQAAIIAGNIFKSNSLDGDGVFSKVSIVTFSDDNIKTIGTYYNQSSFQAGINKVNIEGGGYEYHCRALMEGMSSRIFTY